MCQFFQYLNLENETKTWWKIYSKFKWVEIVFFFSLRRCSGFMKFFNRRSSREVSWSLLTNIGRSVVIFLEAVPGTFFTNAKYEKIVGQQSAMLESRARTRAKYDENTIRQDQRMCGFRVHARGYEHCDAGHKIRYTLSHEISSLADKLKQISVVIIINPCRALISSCGHISLREWVSLPLDFFLSSRYEQREKGEVSLPRRELTVPIDIYAYTRASTKLSSQLRGRIMNAAMVKSERRNWSARGLRNEAHRDVSRESRSRWTKHYGVTLQSKFSRLCFPIVLS